MVSQRRSQDSDEVAGSVKDLIGRIRLFWRLLNDPRVPTWVKGIPLVALLYLLFPIDLIPDPMLGLGQLDDLAVILLGLKFFRDFCPQAVVQDHENEIAGTKSSWQTEGDKDNGSYIDAEYKVLGKE